MVNILYIVVHYKPVHGTYSIHSCTLKTCAWYIFYTLLYITNPYMVHILYIVVHYKPVHGSYSIYSCTLQTCTWCSGATVARLTPDQKAARSISSFLLVGFRIYIICFLIFPFPETSFFLWQIIKHAITILNLTLKSLYFQRCRSSLSSHPLWVSCINYLA